MERRSTRGRVTDSPISATTTPHKAVHTGNPNINHTALPTTPLQVMETPEVASEEVVLNRRGMPARQRKRNRFYFDDDNIVTGDNIRKSLSKSPFKKVKQEPVDSYNESGDLGDASFPPFVQEEVQVQSTPRGSSSSPSKLPVIAANSMMQKVNKIVHKEQKSNTEDFPKGKRTDDLTPGKRGLNNKTTPKTTQLSNKKVVLAKQVTPVPKHVEKSPKGDKAVKLKTPSTPVPPPSVNKYPKGSPNSQVTPSNKTKHNDIIARTNKPESAPRGRPPKDPEAHAAKLRAMENSVKATKEPSFRIKKEPLEISPRSSARSERENKLDSERERQHQRDFERERAEKEKIREREKKKEKERLHEKRDRDFVPSSSKTNRTRRPSTPVANYVIHQPGHQVITTDGKETHIIDKKIAHDISLRLRNLLKLPKAHKWVCYEWFYSNIDKVLFEGENDFQICLKESFPQLKARKLTRVEWCKIRRLMGKPRRCSQAFFDEEREELARRRQKIRMIQQRKVTDFNYKELPDEIPLQLVIGTKVTARLRKPQDGLFTGTIEGVDTSNNTYRITFDRGGLGTHSIPDYEVLSNEQPETVSTSSFAMKIPRRSYANLTGGFKFQNASLLSEDGVFGGLPKSPFPVDGMLGGFPIRLLDMIVRLSKLLKAKREKILQLKELNVEAEKMRSYSKPFNDDYRMRYARCVLDLDSMNKEMSMYLDGIQQYCLEIAPDHGANQMIVPEDVQNQCKQEAHLIVDTYNTKQNRNLVHNSNSLSMISNLTSLMLQVKTLSAGDRNLYELKSIKDTIKDIKASVVGTNVQLFQDRIEIPLNRIQAGLCVSGPSKQF